MRRARSRLGWIAAATGVALALGVLGAAGFADERWSNQAFFAAWCIALLLLFALALLLPLRIGGPAWRAALGNAALTAAAVAVVFLANVAVFRHDVHLDVSREGANTPPPQLQSLVEALKTDMALTYFYNAADGNAVKAHELLAFAARQNPRLRVRAVDLDKEPATARRFGIRAYNTAVVEAEGRRVVVENTADLRQIAFAALRALNAAGTVVCAVTGHGETVSADPGHVHFSHVETLKGHEVPGAGDVVTGPPDGLDRLLLAMATLGYSVRPISLAAMEAVPAECSLVAEIGPRRPYAPGEADALAHYAAAGGRLLLMIDPAAPLASGLDGFLGRLGLSAEEAIVVDPLNHHGADADKVAVPYYPPHPITNRVALTIFPEARPIRVDRAPDGISTKILVSSSGRSYLRRLDGEAAAEARGPAILAVALEGRWPDAAAEAAKPFRLVLVGNSNFATNAYFPYVSNGELVIGMVRWLAGDETSPAMKPQAYSLGRIDLTRRQMRDIFIAVELLLPLGVVLLGGIVWWRRR
jgi:hypothetical protein